MLGRFQMDGSGWTIRPQRGWPSRHARQCVRDGDELLPSNPRREGGAPGQLRSEGELVGVGRQLESLASFAKRLAARQHLRPRRPRRKRQLGTKGPEQQCNSRVPGCERRALAMNSPNNPSSIAQIWMNTSRHERFFTSRTRRPARVWLARSRGPRTRSTSPTTTPASSPISWPTATSPGAAPGVRIRNRGACA